MGTQQSTPTQIQKFWQETPIRLLQVPGQPKLVHSLRRPTLEAERYIIEMINTNQQQQASIFRERKISHQNIVNVYDFEIKKGLLGCARNANCYDIVTERIRYRLARFNSLTSSQMIYVFHQCLCGYGQLSRYDKLCYPNANTIGIKQNGQIKVWINQNWSDNGYRQCRYKSMSIDALWNCIKMCGDSRSLVHFNQKYYKLDRVSFDNVIDLIRGSFGKEVVEGRFALESRVKSLLLQQQKINNMNSISINPAMNIKQNQNQVNMVTTIRPRAVSEQLRKNANNFQPTSHPVHFINRNINSIPFHAQNIPFINVKVSEPLYKQAEANLISTKTSLKGNGSIEKPQSSYPYRKVPQYQQISVPVAYQIQNLYLSTANTITSRHPFLTQSQAYVTQQKQSPPHIIYNNIHPPPHQQQNFIKKPSSITPNRSPPPLQYISKSLDNPNNNTHVRYDTPPIQKKLIRENQLYDKSKVYVQGQPPYPQTPAHNHNVNFNLINGHMSSYNYSNVGGKINQFSSNIPLNNPYTNTNTNANTKIINNAHHSNSYHMQSPSKSQANRINAPTNTNVNILNTSTNQNPNPNINTTININNAQNKKNTQDLHTPIPGHRYTPTNIGISNKTNHPHTQFHSHNSYNIHNMAGTNSSDYDKKKLVSMGMHYGQHHTTNTNINANNNNNPNNINTTINTNTNTNTNAYYQQNNNFVNHFGYSYKNSEFVPENLQQAVAMRLESGYATPPYHPNTNINTSINTNNNNSNANSQTNPPNINHHSNIKFRQANKQYHNLDPLNHKQYNQNHQQHRQQYQYQNQYQQQEHSQPPFIQNNNIIPELNLQKIQNRQELPHPKQDFSTQRPMNTFHPTPSEGYTSTNRNNTNNSNNSSAANSQVTRHEFKSERQTMQQRQKQKANEYIKQIQNIELLEPSTHQLHHTQHYQNIHNIPTSPPTTVFPTPDTYIFQSPVKSNKKKVLQIYPQIQIHNYSTISEKEMSNEEVSELENSSDSKKVAEEFKYYLRSIQKSPKKDQQNQQNLGNNTDHRQIHNSKYNTAHQLPSEKRARNVYDASIIPQRWEQQESFSQVF